MIPPQAGRWSSIRSWQIAEGDMQLISEPLDMLGINYYLTGLMPGMSAKAG
ncbi:hypothetical protein [Paenibacillus riograndensis]|uniref:hypothetical protein n=1 Tax=Paenibacillus riograndensis TaxID=483937 RepID=UPI0002EE5AB9|nr:hypothetical protein [Paenibacillus riograndensis]